MNFDERLIFLIKERKKTPWGKSLGFTSPSITAMFNGHIPGPEFLSAIHRAENVNLNWLLTGQGQPYVVSYYQSAEALNDIVQTMLDDEDWMVYVCAYQKQATLVLCQPGAYEFKGKMVDYTITEVLVGPGSEQLADILRKHNERVPVFVPLLTELEREQITCGQVGTYKMFHSIEPLLTPLADPDISELEFGSTTPDETPVSLPLMRAVVRLVESSEQEAGLSNPLTTDQKSRIITAVYRQAVRLNVSPDELTSDDVETAFDVLRD
ncbi:transcriptional regulator [Vibrio spartinae]|uniref:Uncharacterized protein n=1 Tax=Vibrio spartinae TaxID=1918945 RepID=A0A1N6M5G6_9VIBR|nr:transcriptional regulator [Vibrio spartinae]SIO94678.1 hypothetical protein VSP9026_02407 [Vibrio spartinae]